MLKLDFSSEKNVRSFVSFSPQKILEKIKTKMNFAQERDIIEADLSTLKHFDFDVLYRMNINYFNNREYLNLEIISIR